MDKYDIPVVLYVFRRTETVRLILEVLKEVRPSVLYVFADGPRNDEEKIKTDEVRNLVDSLVTWECDFRREYSSDNLSCSPNITRGYDKVLEEHPYAIFLEDDAVPRIEFFKYCRELLKKYEADERIQYIAGFNGTADGQLMDTDYDFATCAPMSGAIAMWRRSWKESEKDCSRWPEYKRDKAIKAYFPSKEFYHMYSNLFKDIYKKGRGEWDVQLNFDQYLKHKYSIVPRINLVRSYGYTEGAFHEQGDKVAQRLKPLMDVSEETFDFPMKEPIYKEDGDIVWNKKYDKKRQETFLSVKGNYVERHINYLKSNIKDVAYKTIPKPIWNKIKQIIKN